MNQSYKISNESILPGGLTKDQISKFLFLTGKEQIQLFSVARDIRNKILGKQCFLRAVVEVSNYCNNNCGYCTMGKNNKALLRYVLSNEETYDAISLIEKHGIRTVLFQSGDNKKNYNLLTDTLKYINHNNLEIIGCIGNLSFSQLKILNKLQIGGYLIKFETSDEQLFYNLRGNSLQNRFNVLNDIRKLNINGGSGIIIGLPEQTTKDIINSLLLLQYLRLPMNSVSPFIPSQHTKLENFSKASLMQTLNFIALLRIANPTSLIPSVSALNLLDKNGQSLGLNAGANTLTINYTPYKYRKLYKIYNEDRIVVESGFAYNIAKKNKLSINTGSSLGVKHLSINDEKKWFENIYFNEPEIKKSVHGNITEFFKTKFYSGIKSKGNLIDLGCGDGRHIIPLLKKCDKITAIDSSKNAIKQLKVRCKSEDFDKVNIIQNSIFETKLTYKYKYLIASNIAQYFNNKELDDLLNIIYKLTESESLIYFTFESNIILKFENGSYFNLSKIYNYTLDDISLQLTKNNYFKIIDSNISKQEGQYPVKLDIGKNIYHKTSTLNEIILQRL